MDRFNNRGFRLCAFVALLLVANPSLARNVTIIDRGTFGNPWTFSELSPGGCNYCHGNKTNAATPVSTNGESDTSLVTVGAHQKHLNDGRIRLKIDCDNCHIVPQTVDEPEHIEASPAELNFSGLAVANALEPIWNRDAATCSDIYCHGARLFGGSNTIPIWTKTDGTQATCGTCHGLPPSEQHPHLNPYYDTCYHCHTLSVHPDGTIDVFGAYHIDGFGQ